MYHYFENRCQGTGRTSRYCGVKLVCDLVESGVRVRTDGANSGQTHNHDQGQHHSIFHSGGAVFRHEEMLNFLSQALHNFLHKTIAFRFAVKIANRTVTMKQLGLVWYITCQWRVSACDEPPLVQHQRQSIASPPSRELTRLPVTNAVPSVTWLPLRPYLRGPLVLRPDLTVGLPFRGFEAAGHLYLIGECHSDKCCGIHSAARTSTSK